MTYWHVFRNGAYLHSCIREQDAIRSAQAIEAEGRDQATVVEAAEFQIHQQTWIIIRNEAVRRHFGKEN